MLYIFGGLPGTGKSELSKYLAKRIGAVYLRIDTIEQTMKNSGIENIVDEGYQVAFSLAIDNLKLGMSVVADSTNPVEISRKAWREIAISAGVAYYEIEVTCSDSVEHKQRVETRVSDISSLKLPSWNEVVEREYHVWTTERILIDTAGKKTTESKLELMNALDEVIEKA
ncbi:MAG: AAA family ATPase [Alteromonadaceae bacterium]|nr:AAA family ATPase [Alteromonadaceae bacterium]